MGIPIAIGERETAKAKEAKAFGTGKREILTTFFPRQEPFTQGDYILEESVADTKDEEVYIDITPAEILAAADRIAPGKAPAQTESPRMPFGR